ncbi:TetR family transcriptional regulator [Streptomyces sp. 2132.2]|uniref:TetR/AcrR family transcriptional regulator n=1 Tax=Streptomyces TaxID=1883 RepID=UPI000F477643|nr:MULTISPECIES: TetR/AcrR family transcriptional regulator [unclassified Streptomyces]ROQ89051.1 TetR family transcriptional regulator [Streptomyces sp. 2132.2]WSI29250.1 TetR/AcrR family transcriptional regulator [Streptomyces sp. NBC_01343]
MTKTHSARTPARAGADGPRPRRTHGGRDRRAQILQAAAAVFIRDGFVRGSVDTIAAEANVAKQTLYNHFGDRDTLVITLVESAMDPLAARFTAVVNETIAAHDCADLPAQFRDFGRRWVRLMLCDDTAALRWRILADAPLEESLRVALRGIDQEASVRAIADQLALLDRAGRLSVPDAEAAARQLRALLIGEAQLQSVLGQVRLDEEATAAIADRGIDMFMRAYGR